MSSATQYQPVPTAVNETTKNTSHLTKLLRIAIGTGIFCLIFGLPFIIYGVLEYIHVHKFSVKPAFCRVNGFNTEREIHKLLSQVNPVWYVDMIEKQESTNSHEEYKILRSDLKITGRDQYFFPILAKHELRQYSIGNIYQCYYYKQLLDENFDAKKNEAKLIRAVQWEKPSWKLTYILLSMGFILLVIEIISWILVAILLKQK